MFDTLNNSLQLIEGYDGKWLKGKVTQNVDPENLDRIQASVPGLYDPNLGDIPWIGPLKMSPFGFGSGYGVFGTPVIGSDVLITLQNGDPNYPVYMHAQCFPNPSEFPSGTAWGFKDPKGNKLVIQDKDIKFESGAGFKIHVDQSGNFTMDLPAGKTGTWNVPHAVWNVTDLTVNASTKFQVVGDTDINGVLIDSPTGNVIMPGSLIVDGGAVFEQLVAFALGINVTGPASVNGHNIGETHHHFNQSGAVTGVVST